MKAAKSKSLVRVVLAQPAQGTCPAVDHIPPKFVRMGRLRGPEPGPQKLHRLDRRTLATLGGRSIELHGLRVALEDGESPRVAKFPCLRLQGTSAHYPADILRQLRAVDPATAFDALMRETIQQARSDPKIRRALLALLKANR